MYMKKTMTKVKIFNMIKAFKPLCDVSNGDCALGG